MHERSRARRRLGWVVAAASLAGCHEAAVGGGACETSAACARGQICSAGRCVESGGLDALPPAPPRDADLRRGDGGLLLDADLVREAGADLGGLVDASGADVDARMDDATSPVADAAALDPDGAPPAPDAGPVDAAPPPVDADVDATPMDAASVDAAPRPIDAAPVLRDSAPPPVDAVSTPVDAMIVVVDAAPPLDRGTSPEDAAPPPEDAAPEDAAPPPEDAAPPPRRGYGEACAAADDCQSGVCVADPDGGGVCSFGCLRSADCPELDVCLLSEGGGVCFRNETGRACRDAADCIEGICLSPPDPVPWVSPQTQCVSRCEADAKCPVGYRCRAVDTDRGPARVCAPEVRAVTTCPDGFVEQCEGQCPFAPGGDPLAWTLCLNLGGPGYCSCACRTAVDCPDGYACADIPELAADRIRSGICMPMSGYRCPVQAVLGAPDQCLTLTCASDDAQPAAAYCSAPCQEDLDCPAGFVCEVSVDGRSCAPGP